MTRALALVACLGAVAHASPRPPDLRAHRLPSPHHLRMRVAAPVITPTPSRTGPVRPRADAVRTADTERTPLSEQLILRVDLGLAVDGARPSGKPTTDGGDFSTGDFTSVRAYGLGQLYLGSRDLGAAGVSTYTASQVRIADEVTPSTPPIESPYDAVTGFQNRTAWVQADHVFAHGWLHPLRARAGRMYVYGPTIVHLDGLVLGWSNPWLDVSVFSGGRVPDFHVRVENVSDNRADPLAGGEVRADLHRFHLPIVLDAATMAYDGHTHSDLAGEYQPRRDVVIRSTSRFEDGRLARQRLVARVRISEESSVISDSQLRTAADWFWDYSSLAAQVNGDPDVRESDVDPAAHHYLDLGPQRPRFETALQAGTVLQHNVDVVARGAIALDLAKDQPLNSHLPDYAEGGAAIEVRVRRQIAVQASALVRDYRRPATGNLTDTVGTPDALPPDQRLGEESLVEGGGAVRYSLGARRFSAQGEIYARRTRYAPVYLDADGNRPEIFDLQGGGRFSMDAWVSERIRLRGEYDVTSVIDEAPELRGLKSLRLWIEGTY